MSVTIEAATRLHEQQIKAATRTQDLAVSVIKEITGAAEVFSAKSKEVLPSSVAKPLEQVSAPVAKLVGTPTDVTSYLTRSLRDWAEVQQTFQAAVLDVIAAHDPVAPVVKSSKSSKSR